MERRSCNTARILIQTEILPLFPRSPVVYFKVKIEVTPSKYPIKDILNKCKILFKNLYEVDNTVIIAIYKEVYNQEKITREIKILSSITKLRNYFDKLYLNVKGGNFNLGIMIGFNGQEEAVK